jgi:integrase
MTGRTRRRANGEGTIFQRSDGRYSGQVYVLLRGGVRKRQTIYGRTREEVHAKLTELLTQAQRGVPAAEKGWTVQRYMDYWLAEVVGPARRPATARAYRKVVERFIVPTLGRKRLDRITPHDVRAFMNRCRDERKQSSQGRGEPVSVRTIQMIHAVLRNALQHAVNEEVLPRNVAKLVKVEAPHYEAGTGLTVPQARTVLAIVHRDRLQSLYVLALALGLRKGELLGLRWVDVDLDAGELHVRQAAQRVGGRLRFDAPKTRRSRRTVPLPGLAVTALREHRAKQAAERLAAGVSWRDSGLVFTTAHGTPIEPRNLNRHWYGVRQRSGLGSVRFHDLRHTCVTLLLDLGTPPHIVQAIAGHSGMEVTMMIYAHASRDEQRRAIQSLGDRLG